MNRESRAAIGRRAGRIRLLPAVLLALAAGLGVAAAAYGFLRWITPVDASKAAAEIDVTRVALTVVAGVGGVVALVIAYRRQRDLEQSRFVERFGAAAAQLGATDVAIRIAGVYAMAGVADESDGVRRQQCIDVLCGYLRLPYDADHGASGRTKLVIKAPRVEHGRVRGETEEHIEYRQNDQEVRATIVRVIADHLRLGAEYSWVKSSFDFRTARLEDVDLSNTTFTATTRFDGATFIGATRFENATFIGADVNVVFLGATEFVGATFTDSFINATCSGDAWFVGASFTRTAIGGIYTNGRAKFDGATFTDSFIAATFTGKTKFDGATFTDTQIAATFTGATRFDGATFANATPFEGSTFGGPTEFGGAVFAGGDVSFKTVNFGAETITFARPKQWGPPAPTFDWDHDVSQKPPNVEPQDWPPAATTAS